MTTTMETIEGYLKQMNLTYKVIPSEDRIILPYTIDDRRFFLIVDRSDKWVRFFIIIVEADGLKKVDKAKLYESLLEANGQLAEIKYFITDQGGDIVSHHPKHLLSVLRISTMNQKFHRQFARQFQGLVVGLIPISYQRRDLVCIELYKIHVQ